MDNITFYDPCEIIQEELRTFVKDDKLRDLLLSRVHDLPKSLQKGKCSEVIDAFMDEAYAGLGNEDVCGLFYCRLYRIVDTMTSNNYMTVTRTG